MRIVTIDPSSLLPYSQDYKIAAVVVKYTGFIDFLDTEPLYKSAAYDITPQSKQIFIPVDKSFSEMAGGNNYVLLLIPNSVQMNEFSTLRQVFALGVKKLWNGAGPS